MLAAFSAIIIAFAFFIQILTGFGGGLISIPLLSLFTPIADAVTLVMLFQFLTGVALFSIYRDVEWGKIKALVPASLVGIVIGVLSLKYFNEDYVRICLAGFIFLYLIKSQLGRDYIGGAVRRAGVHGAGFFGGLVGGLIGMGAPLYVVYFKETGSGDAAFRANMLVILFLTYLVRLPLSAGFGFIDADLLMLFAIALPGFIIAMIAGQKLHIKVPKTLFQNVVDGLLFLSALSLLAKTIL